MAIVLKEETTLGEQKRVVDQEIFKLKRELNSVTTVKKKKARKRGIKWAIIGSVIGFFAFPVSGIIGYFLGYHLYLNKFRSLRMEKIKMIEKKNQPIIKGFNGEELVSKKIQKELSNEYILINDITIPSQNGKGTQIDHVLLCPNGNILCIETKNIKGIYYPHKDGWRWFPEKNYMKSSKQYVMKSPQEQSIYHANQLKFNLKKLGLNHIDVHAIVVLTNPDCKWKGHENNCPVLKLNNLIGYINMYNSENKYSSVQLKKLASRVLGLCC